jgi:hypothetical protein
MPVTMIVIYLNNKGRPPFASLDGLRSFTLTCGFFPLAPGVVFFFNSLFTFFLAGW